MSLSGNLGFVSLDEVLRLLTRSNQQGSVEVHGEDVNGRIYVTKGGIALATTSNDDGMRHHLIKSGLVEEAVLEEVEAGNSSLAPIVEKTGGALTELLREMTVESIFQLGLHGDGFEVHEGAETRYASPERFELENLLDESKQRIADWAEVSKSVADLEATMRFSRDIGDREEVKIDRDSWRVLSEIGAGSSVRAIADQLGTTEFWTARVTARLIDKALVGLDAPEEDAHEPYEEATYESSPQAESVADPQESWWQEPETNVPTAADETVDEPEQEASQDAESYVDAPTDEIPAAVETEYFQADETEAEAEEPAGMPSTDSDDADTAVEEDTEAFLEKVFSELDSGETDEPEEEGYGLLRRRRLGAIRDVANDA